MLARALNGDIASGFAEIQKQVEDGHARNEVLTGERDALALRVQALEEQVKDLRGEKAVLEEEVRTERELSGSVGLAAWRAMEAVEGAVLTLGAVPPARCHRPSEMDITFQRLERAGEVFVPAARAYGDHCAKATWFATLASLDKAGCAHIDGLAARAVAVATPEETAAARNRTRKAGRVLLQDY